MRKRKKEINEMMSKVSDQWPPLCVEVRQQSDLKSGHAQNMDNQSVSVCVSSQSQLCI